MLSERPARRGVLGAALAGAGALALGGCATGGIRNHQAVRLAPGATGPIRGRITVWSWDVAAQAMKRLAPAFQKLHPGTRIDVVDIGYDNAYDKITVGLTADSGLPDILTCEGSQLPAYIGNFPHGLHDLTPLAARYRTRFDAAAWKTVTDDRGHVYALPWDIGPVGLFYRRDLFARAHIRAEHLTSWRDFVQASVSVKTATGAKAVVMDPATDGLLPLLLQQQGQRYYAGGRVAVDTPAAVRALTLLKELADRKLVDWEKGWDGLVTGTKQGKAATTPTAAWWSGTLTSEMRELKGRFGIVPLPAFTPGTARTSNDGGSTLTIPAQSRNPQLAWAFVRHLLTDRDNQVSMLKHEGLFPAYLPALDDPYVTAPQPYYGGERAMKTLAGLVRSIPPVEYNKDGAKASDIMTNAVGGVLLRGRPVRPELRSAATQIAGATGRRIATGQPR